MADSRWQHMWDIFHQALAIEPGDRAAFLDAACWGDEPLREEIEALLRSSADARGFLETPILEKAPFAAEGMHDRLVGERVGPYRIVRVIGGGGMGTVYEAEQEREIRRRVAVKVIKLGMDTREVVLRFEAERQALALLGHPNIATVYDAGATADGRPYFAMEYVAGMSITDHCDEHRLSARERIDLFLPACEAIQHAHQKGIIHRDLKPSNLLVAMRDGKPVPKVIDFGIAKAVTTRLTERTLYTQAGQFIGTPEYMSPEQAEMSGSDLDARTDVYSLGVLLYEILVGALPFDRGVLRQGDCRELSRRVREGDLPTPSRRFRGLTHELSQTAAGRRRTTPAAMLRELRGDLDWITMKALEPDRARRYAAVSDLASDLRRHLKDEPIVARPPSAAYLARKLVRRHRVGFAVAAAFAGWSQPSPSFIAEPSRSSSPPW